jgi:hypothetical protein
MPGTHHKGYALSSRRDLRLLVNGILAAYSADG